jgi:hypothetical protein
MQVMFPSACSFIVCWFLLFFTTFFGLHGHLQVCRILHIFKDSASLLFWFAAFFFFTWSHSACFPFVFCSCVVFLRVVWCFLAYAFFYNILGLLFSTITLMTLSRESAWFSNIAFYSSCGGGGERNTAQSALSLGRCWSFGNTEFL